MIHATHSRRAVLALAAAWSLPLAGCGFKLRGVYESPFKTLYVSMNKNSRLANDIIRRIKA
ncbi:MAG: hypothetical protein HUK26_09555, partial [Duodenibacillus sp.]|nr:hypothetical protein [Duodenibacillus sp.]